MAKKNQRLINRILLMRISQLLLFIFVCLSIFWPKRDLIAEWKEKTRIEAEISKWEKLLKKYPGYRDVYLRLAVLNWQIKNIKKSQECLQKAKAIDPNFLTTKKLEKILQ